MFTIIAPILGSVPLPGEEENSKENQKSGSEEEGPEHKTMATLPTIKGTSMDQDNLIITR